MYDRSCYTCIQYEVKNIDNAQYTNAHIEDEEQQKYCWQISPENGCMSHISIE